MTINSMEPVEKRTVTAHVGTIEVDAGDLEVGLSYDQIAEALTLDEMVRLAVEAMKALGEVEYYGRFAIELAEYKKKAPMALDTVADV